MLDLTALDAALKQHYSVKRVRDMVYKKNPLLAMVPKYTKFGGKNLPVPIRYADPANRSAGFQQGQRSVGSGPSSTSASAFQDFLLTRVKNYSFAYLDGETVEAAQGDMNTFVREATNEINGAINIITRDLAGDLYKDGTGVRGRVSGTPGTTMTLATTEDVVNFEVGMALVVATTATGTIRSSSDVPTISGINRDTGVITLSTDVSGYGSAWADGDYVFAYGDAPNNSGLLPKVVGLDGWIPSSAPGATSFFGVDRSIDTTRLGGVRYDGTSETIEEALIGAAVRLSREGGSPDCVFMNQTHVGELLKSLGSKVQYDVAKSHDGIIGFDAIRIHTPAGVIKVIADLNCPVGVAYMLQMDTWKLYSLGESPKFLSQDGLKMLRQATSDSYEVRLGYYAQFGCDAPGWNCRIALPTS